MRIKLEVNTSRYVASHGSKPEDFPFEASWWFSFGDGNESMKFVGVYREARLCALHYAATNRKDEVYLEA